MKNKSLYFSSEGGGKNKSLYFSSEGGVCWTKLELSLSKIQTPTEAKLFRNFSYGERAKNSSP